MTANDNRGDLYVITEGLGGHLKIGRSTNVRSRLTQLQAVSPAPLEIVVVAVGCGWLESTLHCAFGAERASNEWFVGDGQVADFADSLSAIPSPTAADVLREAGLAIDDMTMVLGLQKDLWSPDHYHVAASRSRAIAQVHEAKAEILVEELAVRYGTDATSALRRIAQCMRLSAHNNLRVADRLEAQASEATA